LFCFNLSVLLQPLVYFALLELIATKLGCPFYLTDAINHSKFGID